MKDKKEGKEIEELLGNLKQYSMKIVEIKNHFLNILEKKEKEINDDIEKLKLKKERIESKLSGIVFL